MTTSSESLRRELAAAEKSFAQNQTRQHRWQQQQQSHAITTQASSSVVMTKGDEMDLSPEQRLAKLQYATNEIDLAQDVSKLFLSQSNAARLSGVEMLFDQARRCEALGHLLCRHKGSRRQESLHQQLFQQEYVPVVQFIQDQLLIELRRTLVQVGYPSSESCETLLDELDGISIDEANDQQPLSATLVEACRWIMRLAVSEQQTISHVQATAPVQGEPAVVIELWRPLVERVRYHFIAASDDDDRATTKRTDRLPELLLGYLREHVWESGVWDVVLTVMVTSLGNHHVALEFVNESVRLAQHVLDERGFFSEHHTSTGPQSQPAVLSRGIEELLKYDAYLREMVDSTVLVERSHHHARPSNRLLSLIDIFVTGDEELQLWWLERERENAHHVLFGEDLSNVVASPRRLVSPRAELFCALIRSIRLKSQAFSFRGPYIRHVAVPLCLQFLDAIDETSQDLRELLVQRPLPPDASLRRNVQMWIELINGVHVSGSLFLQDSGLADDSQGGDELTRFGENLFRLGTVLVDDLCNVFVETVLMERAKVAGYLMRCSFLLSNDGDGDDGECMSNDLIESKRLLDLVLTVCWECDDTCKDDAENQTPRMLRDGVTGLLADKFLEVALDSTSMVPDLYLPGCRSFANDVAAVFDDPLLKAPPVVSRLLDTAKLMAWDAAHLAQIGNALCELVGMPAPLTMDLFADDERLYDEATSMLHAKGLAFVTLHDVLSILNRRRDI